MLEVQTGFGNQGHIEIQALTQLGRLWKTEAICGTMAL